MATTQEVEYALELFHQNRPGKMLEKINKAEMGLLRLLRYLSEAQQPTTAKEMSLAFDVSTARMTVMLQNLEQKGLIVKNVSPTDARAVLISLSEQGHAATKQLKERMFASMEKVVDEFGIAELEKLFQSLGKIQSILHDDAPLTMEEILCSK